MPGRSRPIAPVMKYAPRTGGLGKGAAAKLAGAQTSTSVRTERPGMTEARRQHADDGVPVVVDAQLAADRRRRRAEAAAPQRVADDEHLVDAGRGVLGAEQPSELRPHAEHVEVRRAREQRLDALGLIDLGEVGVDRPDAGDAVEQPAAIAIVEQLRLRQADVASR